MYKGAQKNENKGQPGVGNRVVKQMSAVIKNPENHILHHDNFFTDCKLLEELAAKGQRAIGTARTNRTEKCPLNVTKKDERGKMDYRSNGNILFAQWKDNAVVTIGTNYGSVFPVKKVSRWVKGKGKTAVDMPALVDDYNKGMGGVDIIYGRWSRHHGSTARSIQTRTWRKEVVVATVH